MLNEKKRERGYGKGKKHKVIEYLNELSAEEQLAL